MKLLATCLALPLVWLGEPVSAPPATDPVTITEWTVPWAKSRPRDPFVDAQNRVWFVGQEGNYVAYLDPSKGEFKRYEIEAGTHPHNLVVDRQGYVWYTGNRNARIGRLDPKSGDVRTFPMPDAAAKDPHTLVFDRSGNAWFTVQFGNYVGRLSPATGKVDLVAMPTKAARPYGIAIDSKNRPWFNEFGTNKLATIDPATMKLREYALPNDRARGRRIAITSDDMIWYVDYTRGYLGRLDPKSGDVKEWANPSAGQSMPYAMAVDDRDRLWYVETGVQPNRLVGFDSKTSQVVSVTPIAESGGQTVRHMTFHAPSRTLWFGTDANTIGRAEIP